MLRVAVTEFTDPGCPFAFSAEPHRLRLRWRYGQQLEWRERLVVLAETRDVYAEKGFTPEGMASSAGELAERYGMPMSEAVKPAVAATAPACRAVVAARVHAMDKDRQLLRRLRHLHVSGWLLDAPETIARAADDVGIDPAALEEWMADPATEQALREDILLARDPTPAALALPEKLAALPEGGWRYTCPSLEFRTADGAALSVPGMQSSLAYETALANVEPRLQRRPEPEDVTLVLRWAGFPVATQEVAEVCGIPRETARERLIAAGAVEEPVGRDGFWTLT